MTSTEGRSPTRPRVVILRGYSANPWDLRPWELLRDRFDISCVVTGSNEFDAGALALPVHHARARRDRLPAGRLGRAAAYAIGDRYDDLEAPLGGADIVHAADLHTWFSAQAAGLRERLGFRLVLTIWETIPFLDAYRWPRERRYRRRVLDGFDLLLPATERARRTLLLEGVDPARMRVCYPGIDTARFRAPEPLPAAAPGAPHRILTPGRLVWEKGHQDVLRAVAALRRGLLGTAPPVELLIVGSGPEERRLRRHAAELGIGSHVEFRATVPYDEMPALYHSASGMVLASLPRRGWEEQFGMVLAEAMASDTSIVAARSGAISEVVGSEAMLFEPGDWYGLAQALLDGPLSRPPAARAPYDPGRVSLFSVREAARGLADAYDSLLASP
ncbi:MAG: glycosyltransferase family 4 protein [Solirubrobacteraceae bacterium]